MTAAGTLLSSGLAVADNIQDTIEDTGSVSLVAGSSTGASAGIRVVGNNADGAGTDPNCNWDGPDEAPLVLNVNTPAGVTANPDPVSITECGTAVPVTFTASSSAVSGVATVSIVSSPEGGGGYNNQVSIPITVTGATPANTPPVVAVTGVTHGEEYRQGAVPNPGCSVTDTEDSNESATPVITGGAHNALGSHEVTCSYTDGGGVTRTAGAAYTVIRDLDVTPPSISYTLDPTSPDGADGWYRGNVTLDWTVTELGSDIESMTGCDDVTVSADQDVTQYECNATSEGGTASKSVSLKRDGTAPDVSYGGLVSGTQGLNGWYTSAVTVTFDATDDLSGVSPASKQVTSTTQGSNVVLTSPDFTDGAGNPTAAGAASSPGFKIDTQAPNAPTAALSSDPNGAGWHNEDVTVTFTAAGDNGPSGNVDCTEPVVVDDEGTRAVSGYCTDEAGNVSAANNVIVKLDKTAPEVSYTEVVSGTEGDNDWYTSDVTVKFAATDELSGPASQNKNATSGTEGDAVVIDSPAFTDAAGNTAAIGAATSPAFKIDKQAPNPPSHALSSPANGAGWHRADVTVSFTDNGDNGPNGSGVDSCTSPSTISTEGTTTVYGTCTDEAGNESATDSITVKLDKTAPTNVAITGGPQEGGKYFPNDLPSKPTCTADDGPVGGSGYDKCEISAYSTALGTRTIVATAYDQAGNTTQVQGATYTVRLLTMNGFFAPVDMGLLNTVKAGSTVPLKFRVYDEGVEQKTIGVIKGFSAKAVSCSTLTSATDAIEEFTYTNATGVRYDTTGGQFIQNWKTPSKANTCYTVTMTTIDDSTISADFKLK